MSRRVITVCAAVGAGILSLSFGASAEWRSTRGDAQRTAMSPASGVITTPGVRWRYYLGGWADARSFLPAPATASCGDVVYLTSSGRVEARRPDDVVVWQSGINGADRVLALSDLDGDGAREVIALSSFAGRAFVYDAATGALRWASPKGRYGSVGVAAMRDVDGDGKDDLYISARGSFHLAGPQYADVWRFAGGAANPTLLWSIDMTTRDYDRAEFDAWADVDGDGRAELVAFGHTHVYVYSPVNGTLVASADLGLIPAAQAQAIVADVDAPGIDAGQEIVVFTNTSYGAGLSTRHTMVLDVADGTVTPRWEHSVVDVVNDRNVFGGESVVDVDGDGIVDVASSFYTASTSTWTTHVWRGDTGAELAAFAGVFVGATDVDGDHRAEVLTRPAPDQIGVVAWDVSSGGAAARWARPDAQWLQESDPATSNRQSLSARTVMIDVDDDGKREVVVQRLVSGSWQLAAFDLADATPTVKRVYPLPPGVTVLTTERRSISTGDHLFVARSDGYMPILNQNLAPINEFHYPTGVIPGLKLGGYFPGWRGINAAPLAADMFGSAAEDIVLRDSRGALLALDPQDGTNTHPPRIEWQTFGARWMPAILDVDGDGLYEVATGDNGTATLRQGQTGAPLWSAPVVADATAHVSGVDLDHDGTNEIGVMSYDPSSADQVLTVLDAGGTRIWSDVRLRSSGRGSFATTDVNGDDVDDVVVEFGSYLLTIDGATGAVIDNQYSGYLSMAPLLADVEHDGDMEVVSSGFGDTYMTWDLDGEGVTSQRARLANNPATEVTYYHYGTFVDCPNGTRFVFAPQNTSHVRVVDPAHGTLVFDAYLAGGEVYASPAEIPDGLAPAFIGNINGIASLGDGTARLLAGSTDGFVYVLRACAAAPAGLLDWSLAFGSAAGEPVPADVDGDGQAEILVAATDGYLYAIDEAVVAAPRVIGEVGSVGDLADGELDEIASGDALVVQWDPVPSAVAYQIGVFDGVGAPLLDPPFRDVGSATTVALDDLPIRQGLPYYTAVRAVAADGAMSFEQVSDGFVAGAAEPDAPVEDPNVEDGGCQAGGGGSIALIPIVFAALVGRRRARCR